MLKFRSTEDIKKQMLYMCSVKSSSANKRFDDKISKWDVYDTLVRLDFKCFYCNENIKPRKWQLDHYNPRASGGKNEFSNLVCTCKWCNTMKNALDGVGFITRCNNIITNNYFALNNIDLDIYEKQSAKRALRRHKRAVKHLKNNLDISKLDEETREVINDSLRIAADRRGFGLLKI